MSSVRAAKKQKRAAESEAAVEPAIPLAKILASSGQCGLHRHLGR